MGIFAGPEEEERALRWMNNRLSDKKKSLKGKTNEDLKKEISTLQSEIKTREKQLKLDQTLPENNFHDDIWSRFIFCISGVEPNEADENWTAPYEFGEWEFVNSKKITIGHSDKLDHTYIPRGGGSARHYYTSPPDCVNWELTPMTQKGSTFLIGKAKVAEIDAVCSVPQLPAEMSSAETAKRVLDRTRGPDEWQRRVDEKRVISISRFIESSDDNIIANSAILFAPSHEAVEVDESTGKVKICFDKFLDNNQGSWSDHKGKNDLRPIWLIDGQHRTRGLAQSEEGSQIDIPIIFFPPSFELAQSAKIFSEINTLQKKLTALHTLYMQHRFSIPSPLGKRDFSVPYQDGSGTITNKNSRANHLAYECAAYLAANKDGPLFDQIKILDQNKSRTTIMTANSWVDFSRFWFTDGGVYGPFCEETQDEINTEVENYFAAFIQTCNHEKWPDGEPRWPKGGRFKSLLQRHGPSQALLKIYPDVQRLAKSGTPGVISIARFKEILKPLMWVDWMDPKFLNIYNRAGERPRTMLRIWMIAAIKGKTAHPYEKVMSETISSQVGQGILSPPGNSKLEVVSANHWPVRNKPVELLATQPENTLPTSSWTIIDSNKVNRTGEYATQVAKNGSVLLEIKHEDWMNNVSNMTLRVDWHNLISPPGFAEISLKKA